MYWSLSGCLGSLDVGGYRYFEIAVLRFRLNILLFDLCGHLKVLRTKADFLASLLDLGDHEPRLGYVIRSI